MQSSNSFYSPNRRKNYSPGQWVMTETSPRFQSPKDYGRMHNNSPLRQSPQRGQPSQYTVENAHRKYLEEELLLMNQRVYQNQQPEPQAPGVQQDNSQQKKRKASNSRGRKKFRKNCYKENFPIRCVSTNNGQSAKLDSHLKYHLAYMQKGDLEQTFGEKSYKNLRDKSGSRSQLALQDSFHSNPYIKQIERNRETYQNEHTCAGRMAKSARKDRSNIYNQIRKSRSKSATDRKEKVKPKNQKYVIAQLMRKKPSQSHLKPNLIASRRRPQTVIEAPYVPVPEPIVIQTPSQPKGKLQPFIKNRAEQKPRALPDTPPKKSINAQVQQASPLKSTGSLISTPKAKKLLKFDNPMPDGSPHKFFNWVDESLGHSPDAHQEIEIQIKKRQERLDKLEQLDTQSELLSLEEN